MTERAVGWSRAQRQRLTAMGYRLLQRADRIATTHSLPPRAETGPTAALAHVASTADGRRVAVRLSGPPPQAGAPEHAVLLAVLAAAGLRWQGDPTADDGDTLTLPALDQLSTDAQARSRLWPTLRALRRRLGLGATP
ncbi:MAG: hypothetical protein WCZ65_03080 [Lysobacteraceae bacterium]